jgi:hypothetical protein
VTGAAITAGAGVFSLGSLTFPFTVRPYESSPLRFSVTFTPPDGGGYFGAAQLQTDLQQTPFSAFFRGAASGKSWTDHFAGSMDPVDILWVMDTADPAARQAVAQVASDIVTGLEGDGIDFQMGVTSTDVCPSGTKAEHGSLLPCWGCHISGSPQIITPNDPTASTDLATLMGLGGAYDDDYCGANDDEQLFDSAYQALVSGAGATNNLALGFIRPGAYLAVITVDSYGADDVSPQTCAWYADQFQSIHGSDHPELFSWSYINPSGLGATGGHQTFNGLPMRIAAMLDLVGGVALDTSQTDWSQGLLDLWQIALAAKTVFPLGGTPDPTTLQVYLDGPPPDQVPAGGTAGQRIDATNPSGALNWSYDATNNALDLNPALVPLQATDTLYVEYTLVCP